MHLTLEEMMTENTPKTDKTVVDRTADLSADVLAFVEDGQRAALEALRGFLDTIDEAIPAIGDHPSRRAAVVDAALDMADKLVATQYDFLRKVVRSADAAVSDSDDAQK